MVSAHLHPGLQHGLSFRGFDDALKSGEPIWVINNSQPKSMLIITITDPLSGKPKTMEFHRTFIPFCLTDMVPREILERSLELRNFVRKGVLKMIPEKDALVILNSSDGRKEHARLNTSEFALGSDVSARVRDMSAASDTARQTAGIAQVADGTAVQGAVLHPQLKNWENRVVVGELDLSSLQSELRIHASEFTESDCLYLINGQFPEEVRAWSKEKLKSGEVLKAPAQSTQQFATAARKYEYEASDRGYEADYEVVK